MFDILIRGGQIIDGSGQAAFPADLGIRQGRIAAIGDLSQAEAARCEDAGGKYLTPGFIDTHSHADCSAFLYPSCESYLRQGITTFIGGQCGDANAPINNYWMRKYWEYDLWQEMDPFVFNPRTVLPVEQVLPVIERRCGYKIKWKSFGEYAQVLRDQGLGCNMLTLAGHSQIRADVMGLDQARRPTAAEMRQMQEHIEEAFAAGVWGLSTGRDYPPSAYADLDELKQLISFTRDLGGYYFTHWKRTGVRIGTPAAPNKLAGILEALDLCLELGVKTQISHLSTGFDVYPMLPEMEKRAAELTLEIIDSYIAQGADVAFDVIPGESGGICIDPYLASYFMPWIKMSGSLAHFRTNLLSRDYREELLKTLRGGGWYALNSRVDPDWDAHTYITKSQDQTLTGRSLRDLRAGRAGDSFDLVLELLTQEPRIMVRRNKKTMAEVRTLISHPRGGVCTDTYAFDLKGSYGDPYGLGLDELLPHPHTYCAFPKFLLELSGGRLEDDIRKISAWPAEFMNIPQRGRLQEGYWADVLVLDRERLQSKENYVEPRVYPQGIDLVVVNGQVAVDGQGYHGALPGRLLSR